MCSYIFLLFKVQGIYVMDSQINKTSEVPCLFIKNQVFFYVYLVLFIKLSATLFQKPYFGCMDFL